MLSKACIVGTYQRKLEEMAATNPTMHLTVAVPPYWKDERGITPLERVHTRGYQLRVLPMALNGQFHLHFYPTFRRLVRELQPDIVHIDEEPYNLATYHANRIARRAGAKTLWFSWQNLHRQYPPPFAWMERYNLQHTHYALTGSQTAAQVWRDKHYAGPLAVIPQFGVDPEMFAPPDARPTGPVHIAYAGRLVPEKGVDILIRALHKLDGDWRATILGGGPQATQLQTLAQQGTHADRITFQDALPSTAMPDFYQAADIFVLASRTQKNWMEQFGRVLIEAMACGTAVVGAESGEIPHVISNAGLTFPENDTNALHAQLHTLIHHPDQRAILAQQGRVRVLTHFTQRHIAAATLKIYEEILD